tara:strand:+ start:236 stop:523 length:288 start_codon:yes stop_codon:yes gene_type:complete
MTADEKPPAATAETPTAEVPDDSEAASLAAEARAVESEGAAMQAEARATAAEARAIESEGAAMQAEAEAAAAEGHSANAAAAAAGKARPKKTAKS